MQDKASIDRLLSLVTAIHDRLTREPTLLPEARHIQRVPEVGCILDMLPAWLWQTNQNHVFTYLSPQYESITGVPPCRFIGKSRLGVINKQGDAIPRGYSQHRVMLENKLPFQQFQYEVNFDGRARWLEVSGWPIKDGRKDFLGYIGIGRDITPEKRALLDAVKMTELFASAVDKLDVSVLILDEYYNIFHFNRRWENLHVIMDKKDFRKGVPYEHYLRTAIYLGLFPDSKGKEEEYLAWRIEQNMCAPESAFIVNRQDDIRLSISVARITGGMTSIISTPSPVYA